MNLLECIGIHGWDLDTENAVLASLITGDPVLLIGKLGSAKTYMPEVLAKALGKKYQSYDASKCLFEDTIGFLNIEKLKQGEVAYLESPITIWDKEIVVIDELNRAMPEMQNKWLEIIRSRKIMGMATDVKWVFAAMNPMTEEYSGCQTLDAALMGRFATFVFTPSVLEMKQEDQIKVIEHISGADAPALKAWLNIEDEDEEIMHECADTIQQVITEAAELFMTYRKHFDTLGEFLARFAVLIAKETDGKIELDGRRLGYLFRVILSVRAVESVRYKLFGEDLQEFSESAKRALEYGIPMGLNEGSVNKEEDMAKIETVLDLLSDYFDSNGDLSKVDTVYRLFTSNDPIEKVRILIRGDISELARTKAWHDMLKQDTDEIKLLAFISLQIEARRPGLIPNELLKPLSMKLNTAELRNQVAAIQGQGIDHMEALESLYDQPSDIGKVCAYIRTRSYAKAQEYRTICPAGIERVRDQIEQDKQIFEELLCS